MKLSAKVATQYDEDPYLAVIDGLDLNCRAPLEHRIFIQRSVDELPRPSIRAVFTTGSVPARVEAARLPPELDYLQSGDIVRVNPRRSEIRVLYRKRSPHNVLFFTEQCNSRCLMCSQPPRAINDAFLVNDILRVIPWMAEETAELGISGGEPTLNQDGLVAVLESARAHLPRTAIHLLSNGRLFAYLRLAERIAAADHPDLMVGVPLYGDTAAVHDFVVQAHGAFEQTILGLLNLARTGVRIEVRIVIHQQTLRRLPQIAQFITRNLPFVDQVVLMGLEPTGYARSNFSALWVDPGVYSESLTQAVQELDNAGIANWIYNHPLCLLPEKLHKRARRSISDWKNIYLPDCESCLKRTDCCGFFASAETRHSARVSPFLA